MVSHTWGEVEEWRNVLILHYRFKLDLIIVDLIPGDRRQEALPITTLHLLTV